MSTLQTINTNRHVLGLLIMCLLLAACATAPPPRTISDKAPPDTPVEETSANPLAIYDPLEGFNRRMYSFNALADRYFLMPVVHTYDRYTPKPVRSSLSNFFANINEIPTFANSVAQLKPGSTGVTLSRFIINSTVGLAGFFDPASHLGLERRNEDFGQTLGFYGVPDGPYLMLPLMGPSNTRDLGGMAGDATMYHFLNPLRTNDNTAASAAFTTLYALTLRDNVNFQYYQTASPFEYTLVRMVYTNYRHLQIED